MVLTYRGPGRNQRPPVEISMTVMRELDPLNTSWPCAYHYLEPVPERDNAVICLMASPGVSIVIKGLSVGCDAQRC